MKSEKIVIGKVIQIYDDKIVVDINNTIYDCEGKMISDYPIDPHKFFELNKSYKFLLINDQKISYKAIRPKLIKNKRKPIPTISDYANLEKYLLQSLKKDKQSKFSNNKNYNKDDNNK